METDKSSDCENIEELPANKSQISDFERSPCSRSRSIESWTSKSSLYSDDEFSEDLGYEEDDSLNNFSVSSPENCVYFLTSSPPGKILYINSNTTSLYEFSPIVESGNGNRDSRIEEATNAPDVDIEREAVSIFAERSSLWALTKDGSLFLYVFPSGAKIRRQVHTYENQRYRLIYGGWTDKLMRVDRYPWSSRGGQKHLPKHCFKLLNEACWKWDGLWRLAEIMDNQPTEQDGWLYAKNFTQAKYGAMGSLSFVRRRKWIRYMSYSKVSQWAKIDNLKHSGMEPDSDLVLLAVGGSLLNGSAHGYLSVWAVRRDGKIIFREGISASRPEGERWRIIEGTDESVVQIVTSPKGHTWALNWTGTVSIRAGISCQTPWGTKWVNLVSQHQETVPRFACLSLGDKSAWAVSAGSQKVYFLPNLEAKLMDYKWIEVVGNMFGIYVGLNNQVWAISLASRSTVFFRDQVTFEELSGKTWKTLRLSFDEIASCRQSRENLSLKDCDVKFCQVTATSFNWGQNGSRTVPLHWFMKIPNFRPSNEVRNDIIAIFADRDYREVIRFKNDPEFLESKKIREDSEMSGLCFNSELSCNLEISSRGQLSVSTQFSNCLVILEKYPNSDTSTALQSKLIFTFAKTTAEIMLSNIIYIRHILNHDKPTLVLTTSELFEQQLYFSILFDTYKELFSWHDTLQQARTRELKDWNNVVEPSSDVANQYDSNVFCVDEMGCCLMHTNSKNDNQENGLTAQWFPLEGHFEKVVSYGNLAFGLNSDCSVWFHRSTGLSRFQQSSKNVMVHRDSLTVCVDEIETWNLALGFHGKYFSVNPPIFFNERKSKEVSDDNFNFVQLPSTRWEWTSGNWIIDYTDSDQKGWSYTADITNPLGFHSEAGRGDIYRRRLHKRTCAISQNSFWQLLSSKPYLRDLTVSYQHSRSSGTHSSFNRFELPRNEQISNDSLWGLGDDGSLYQGSISEPSKDCDSEYSCNGFRETEFCWKQVVNDYTLLSICAAQYAGGSILWGICQDGITLLLHYHSYSIPIDGPPVVQPPHKQSCLQKVECGGNRTLTVVLDCYNMVWLREGASWDYPEGASWSKLACGVTDISVDADSNVWVVLESFKGQSGVVVQLRNQSNNYANSIDPQRSPSSSLKYLLYHPYHKEFIPILKLGPSIKYISANSFSQQNETT